MGTKFDEFRVSLSESGFIDPATDVMYGLNVKYRYDLNSAPGTVNLGSLGGMPQENGGTTQHGVFYRCAAPAFFMKEGLLHLDSLGIKGCVDLRGAGDAKEGTQIEECDNCPGCQVLPRGIYWKQVDVMGAAMTGRLKNVTSGQVLAILSHLVRFDKEGAMGKVTDLMDMGKEGSGLIGMYNNMIEYSGPQFGEALGYLADFARNGKPAIFHCAVGKDRTGLIAMFLLRMCGVPERVIVDNYAESQQQLKRVRKSVIFKQHVAMINHMHGDIHTGTPAYAMRFALNKLNTEYGGPVRYLLDVAKLPVADIETVRSTLMGPAKQM